jgi:chromate transport protein ChrA
MAIHIGYIFGGLAGLIITGVCFITPAVLITGFLAWIYTTYGTLPDVAPIFAGIKPISNCGDFSGTLALRQKGTENPSITVYRD